MSRFAWTELRELCATLDKMNAEYSITRTIGPYNRANQLERQIGELTARREELIDHLIGAVLTRVE